MTRSIHAIGNAVNEFDALVSAGASPLDIVTKALRISPCPRPANDQPDDLMAGECFDSSMCGCLNGVALFAASQEGATP